MSRKRKLIADVLVQNVRFPMHGEGKIGVTPVTFKGGIKGQRVQVMVQKKKEELYEAKIMERSNSLLLKSVCLANRLADAAGVCTSGCIIQRNLVWIQ